MDVMGKPPAKFLTVITILAVFFAIIMEVYGQTINVGVSPGDSFTYSFNVFWSSQDPEDKPPSSLVELNKTEFIKLMVHEVAGPVVILNLTTSYCNGSERFSQIFVNLLSGDGDGFGLIVPPDLEVNSLVYPLGINSSNSFTIKEEFSKSYSFGERMVLHATINKTDDPEYMLVSHNIYYDKKTGVMLEWIIDQIPRENPRQKIRLTWQITGFNVKPAAGPNRNTQPEALHSIAAAIAAIAILMSLLAYRRRRRFKHKK